MYIGHNNRNENLSSNKIANDMQFNGFERQIDAGLYYCKGITLKQHEESDAEFED
jgi:hypothetical protein